MEIRTMFGGVGGIGASEASTVSKIKGMKKKDEMSFRFTGAIMGRLTGGPRQSTTITRLDKDTVWTLDEKSKKYTEVPISQIREKGMTEEEKSKKEKPRPRIVRSEFSVKKTGAKKAINGFPCEEYILTWLVETEDAETKEHSINTMTTHQWNTPETLTIKRIQQEQAAFDQSYLKKLGMKVSAEEMKKFGFAAFLPLGGADDKESAKRIEELRKEMTKAKGYPIVMDVRWEMGAPTEGGSQKGAKAGKPAFSSYTEVKRLQVLSIPDLEFEIPAGYEKK